MEQQQHFFYGSQFATYARQLKGGLSNKSLVCSVCDLTDVINLSAAVKYGKKLRLAACLVWSTTYSRVTYVPVWIEGWGLI